MDDEWQLHRFALARRHAIVDTTHRHIHKVADDHCSPFNLLLAFVQVFIAPTKGYTLCRQSIASPIPKRLLVVFHAQEQSENHLRLLTVVRKIAEPSLIFIQRQENAKMAIYFLLLSLVAVVAGTQTREEDFHHDVARDLQSSSPNPFCPICLNGNRAMGSNSIAGLQCQAADILGRSRSLTAEECSFYQALAAVRPQDPCECGDPTSKPTPMPVAMPTLLPT